MILAHVVDHCKPAQQTLTSNRFFKRRIDVIFDTWSTWHQYQKRRIIIGGVSTYLHNKAFAIPIH